MTVRGVRLGVPICEDIWKQDVANGWPSRRGDFAVPNGSPFEAGKEDMRLAAGGGARQRNGHCR